MSAGTKTAFMAGVTMLAFAANSALCRAAMLGEGAMHPLTFTLVRVLGGALVVGGIVRFRSTSTEPSEPTSRGGHWAPAIALGTYAVFFSAAYTGLDAGTGALILFGAVQLTMFGHAMRSAEPPGTRAWLGMLVAMGGLAYMLAPGVGQPAPVAAACMGIAGLAWGAYSILGRGSRDPTADTGRAFVRVAAFACLLVPPAAYLAPRLGYAPMHFGDTHALAYALASGTLASGMGYVLWYATLPRLAGTSAAVIQLSVPLIAALAGAAWLSEAPSPRVLAATPVILLGIGIVVTGRRP